MIIYPAIRCAYAFAADLDRLLAVTEDDWEQDALQQVGELLGGLSRDGFHHDLAAALDAEVMQAEDRDRGGEGHARLSDLTWFALNWLRNAKLIMLPAVDYLRLDPPKDVRGRRAAA